MDTIPPEIWNLILSYLEAPFARYAAVSRPWQRFFEQQTFRSLRVRSDSLPQLGVCFAVPHRRICLKELEFWVLLPDVSLKRMKKMQSTVEAAANNAAFTREIHALFTLLNSWSSLSETGSSPAITLELGAESAQDRDHPPLDNDHRGEPIWEHRDEMKYLDFDPSILRSLNGLPSARVVRIFSGFLGRRFDPACFSTLALSLTAVENLRLYYASPDPRLPALRARIRSALVQSLFGLSENITSITIFWNDRQPHNQSYEPSQLIGPSQEDPLCSALGHLSRLPALQTLVMKGYHIISSGIFAPECDNSSRGEVDNTGGAVLKSSQWPSLRSMLLQTSLVDAYGSWFFTGDPEAHPPEDTECESHSDSDGPCDFNSADSDESDYLPRHQWAIENGFIWERVFRDTPDDRLLAPLIKDVVGTFGGLPNLRSFTLSVGYPGHPGLALHYHAPGTSYGSAGYKDEVRFHNARVHQARWSLEFFSWHFNESWVPSPEFKAAFGAFLQRGCVFARDINGFDSFSFRNPARDFVPAV